MRCADVLAPSHFGTIRALVANLEDLSEADMMSLKVPNGDAFLFERTDDGSGGSRFIRRTLPEDPVIPKAASDITPPPAAAPLRLEALFARRFE